MTSEVAERKLLVVDDDPAVLKLLKALLTRAKYRFEGCQSGDEALKLLSQRHFDLIITDAIMPVMSGFELVRAIRANPSLEQVPILMLTRKNDRTDVKKALEAGVSDYVIKPIDEYLLLDKVDASLRTRSPTHRLREVSIHGTRANGWLEIESRIIALRETGIVLRLPSEIQESMPLRLRAPIFEEIGIASPILRRVSGELHPREPQSGDQDPFKGYPFEAEFVFVGVGESELRKIRTWLQKQEIRRKK